MTDGSEEVIGTDETWQIRRSKISFSNVYDGEHRDDTLPDLPAEQAVLCDAPKGELTDRMSLPVTVHETFRPKELIHTPAGELVFDMGQEFTGIFKLHVNVPKGTKVHVQTGEILQHGNFYNENLRSAKSEYIYISDGTEIDLVPHFTFYGYRYVKIDGIPDMKKEDFTGLAYYSNITATGWMKTGSDLVNQLISNVRWGLKCNFVDVPTDCPQRDERMGWTGDAQVVLGRRRCISKIRMHSMQNTCTTWQKSRACSAERCRTWCRRAASRMQRVSGAMRRASFRGIYICFTGTRAFWKISLRA